MAYIEAYPQYGTQEEKDLWLQRFADRYNQLNTVGSGGGGTGDVEVNDNSQVISTTTDRVLGWSQRYLHIRVTSDAAGQVLVTPVAASGTVFVHVFNSSSEMTPGSDANFIIDEQFTGWVTGDTNLYYTVFGLNNVRFAGQASTPMGASQITASEFRIDLEAGVGTGAQGPAGANAITITIEARMRPLGVNASSLIAPNTVDPSTWDFASDGLSFRNSSGATRSLVAFVQVGGVTQSLSSHQGYTYSWTRNGEVWTPSLTGTDRMSRWIPIDANDVDGFSDQFIVDVNNI